MVSALLRISAPAMFAVLLVIMIVVAALFGLILWIALRPIKKDELDDSSSAKKALGRRETELTIELLNKQNDAKARAELEGKLREVQTAEKLVSELMDDDDAGEQSGKEAKAKQKTAKKKANPPKDESPKNESSKSESPKSEEADKKAE